VAARSGDRLAFDRLVSAAYPDVYTLAHRLTGNEEDARDVAQEVFLRAYRGLRRFRGDAKVATWLYRITANCASSHVARRRRQRAELLGEEHVVVDVRPEHDPGQVAELGDLRSQLVGALRALPPKLRSVIVLRDVYDLQHDVIASELGISETAAKVRLHRARRRLHEQLFVRREDSDRDSSGGSSENATRVDRAG
jgi:RNA polymerase sigma-70 factor, ECF subfamily